MAVTLPKRRFTVAEYHKLAEAGILSEDERVELIEGEIVAMAPIGSRHAGAVKRLLDQFIPLQAARRVLLSVQDPIRLGEHSEPQPDVALLRPRPDFYAAEHPGPEEVLLVVEVAETSAEYDREVKVPLYARFGVPEVWLVDLAGGMRGGLSPPLAPGLPGGPDLAAGRHRGPLAAARAFACRGRPPGLALAAVAKKGL
ncbi:MAG: hypothetical protein KatS3mg131_1956 [Candidatus Tectimicrobiota bacterium]|nr:MAG: hypothetical protein KatS3mg131_1956 [Candidatus Tectomicrobia bacterium]